jgi:hypothetical protein
MLPRLVSLDPPPPPPPPADPSRAAAAAGAEPAAPSRPVALSRGPVTLADADTRKLLNAMDTVTMRSGKDLIQATFSAAGDASSGMSAMTEKVRWAAGRGGREGG